MVKQELFRWASSLCGCLKGPVFSFPNPKTGNEEVSEELHIESREERLTGVLAADTLEFEHHWLSYDFEECQVKIDITDMIFETLIDEICHLMA
jgi:hypothetical protein